MVERGNDGFWIVNFIAGCIIGVLGSFYVTKHFHRKSMDSQQVSNYNLSDIRSIFVSLHRDVTANTFQTVAWPLIRSVHKYVSSLASLGQEINQLKEVGSNRKVQMLIGEIEVFNDSLSESLSIGEDQTTEQTDSSDWKWRVEAPFSTPDPSCYKAKC